MRLHPWMSQGGHKESQDAVTESSSIRVASVEPKKLIPKPNQKSAVNALLKHQMRNNLRS